MCITQKKKKKNPDLRESLGQLPNNIQTDIITILSEYRDLLNW